MIKTTIVEIGEVVPAFAEELLLVLFGTKAPAELRPICVIHDVSQSSTNPLKVGTIITIGNQDYTVTKVGDAANKNFDELGHISIYFRTGETDVLPGAISVEPAIFPTLNVGDEIIFKDV